MAKTNYGNSSGRKSREERRHQKKLDRRHHALAKTRR